MAGSSSRKAPERGTVEPDDRDLIAGIIADLAKEAEEAFSRPSSKYRASTDQYSASLQRQRDFYQIRSNWLSSTSLISQMTLEMESLEDKDRGDGSRRDSKDEICGPAMLASYQTSKRSSLAGSGHLDVADSAISLVKKDKRTGTKSHLREAHAVDEERHTRSGSESDDRAQTPLYPSAAKTTVIMVSLYISIFLVALDRTIMGPAIPAITNQFNSIGDIGWYGSSYMLTCAGFILVYGRIYTFFSTKVVFLSSIFLFEVGSAVCGAAQTSNMLIIGRSVAGLGSSGIFTGAILIMLNTVPLHRRPILQGLFGACFGVASVAGPLLGGAFTGSKATWRWCFYINLPLGGLTILVVLFLLKLDEQKQKLANWKETARNLDPLGTVLFLPAITCLLLALEWGAADYSWSSPRLIALLAVFAILLVAFVVWQYFTRNTTATVPARIIFQRSIAFGGLSQFCVGATMLTISIYIPLWFQAIKGVSAMQSGINTIPLVLAVVVGSILSGGLTQKIGYYTPFMILGSCLMATGTGLLTTWNINTSSAMWIGYQVILGLGVGCTMQHPNLAAQVVLPKQDIPTGTAVLSLCQTLGGAVFTAVGQNLYIAKFTSGLQSIGGLQPKHILNGGATDLTTSVPLEVKMKVLQAYNNSLTKGTFFAALIVACFAVPAALGMEWRNVKEKQGLSQASAAQTKERKDPADESRRSNDGRSERSPSPSKKSGISTPELARPAPAYTVAKF